MRDYLRLIGGVWSSCVLFDRVTARRGGRCGTWFVLGWQGLWMSRGVVGGSGAGARGVRSRDLSAMYHRWFIGACTLGHFRVIRNLSRSLWGLCWRRHCFRLCPAAVYPPPSSALLSWRHRPGGGGGGGGTADGSWCFPCRRVGAVDPVAEPASGLTSIRPLAPVVPLALGDGARVSRIRPRGLTCRALFSCSGRPGFSGGANPQSSTLRFGSAGLCVSAPGSCNHVSVRLPFRVELCEWWLPPILLWPCP